MARKATKDTYATENVGGVEVRRMVFAGDTVPEQYEVEDGSVEETEDSKSQQNIGKQDNGDDEGETSAAYGDSPDPAQQEQAEQQQGSEQQQEPQSPAQPKRGRNR